ncbi:hypothetical protein GE061_001019 [Apolygus lucorum]|uniref:Uncharacterized protein n=1 Tax=Apolygus lucorum TaxID=248454 RepID=A0A6A4K380_APOLU|nr:hypothetical protein GE061_001019 [Apolygus lucorum]
MPKSDGDSDYQPDSEDFSDEEDIGSPSTLTTQEITDILLENGLRIRTPKISKKVSFTPLLCESETIEDIPCSVIVDGVLQDLPAVTVSSTISTVNFSSHVPPTISGKFLSDENQECPMIDDIPHYAVSALDDQISSIETVLPSTSHEGGYEVVVPYSVPPTAIDNNLIFSAEFVAEPSTSRLVYDPPRDDESDHDDRPLTQPNEQKHPEVPVPPEPTSRSRSRKRVSEPKEWTRARAKSQRMCGEAYLGFRRVDKKKAVQDVMREKREMGPTCNAPLCKKWRNRLCDTVKQEERQQLYDEFWKNMTWESKKMFVCATVDILQVKKRTKKKPHSNKERSRSFAYFLRVNGERIPVCKNMYLSSLGLRENEVRYWIESFIENNQPSMRRKASSVAAEEMQEPDEEDQRQEAEEKEQGQEVDEDEQELDIQLEPTPNPRRRLPETRSFVEAFFAKLPTLPSHYCRKNSKKLYIQTNLTSWSLLYQMYKQTCQENDEMEPLSRYYFDHIRKKRNLGLYAPKKDRCDLCCSFELGNASPEVFEAHQKKKNLAREEKEHDKEAAIRGECHTIVLDLMKVQTCPWITASSAYFKLKLVVHNYTVYNLSNHDSKLYWFDETQASLSASTARTEPMPYRAVLYTSIRPGKAAGDPTVVDLRALKYTPEGKIYFKLNFDEDYQEMPRRSKRTSFNPVEEFPPLFATRPKIPKDKFMDLQSLKPLLPSDTYAFYDSIPHQEESQRQVKRQKVAETKKQ